MGAVCGKSNNATPPVEEGGTLRVMFHRFDKDNKGFISTLDLQKMMRDDKTHFQGKDANHISKFSSHYWVGLPSRKNKAKNSCWGLSLVKSAVLYANMDGC